MAELAITGPALELRLPRPADAPALFALASDPEVTRWFSWGPYAREAEAEAFLATLPARREHGEALDLAIVGRATGIPIGLTALSELAVRDRRAVVGTWLGRAHWGTGANREAKALLCHLAFAVLGLERLGSYTNVEHERSQRALERLGFRHEGVLRGFHRHGDRTLDVCVFGLLRADWEAGPLRDVPITVAGDLPPAWPLATHPTNVPE